MARSRLPALIWVKLVTSRPRRSTVRSMLPKRLRYVGASSTRTGAVLVWLLSTMTLTLYSRNWIIRIAAEHALQLRRNGLRRAAFPEIGQIIENVIAHAVEIFEHTLVFRGKTA